MNLIQNTSTNSPHYFYCKRISTINENLNFNVRVKWVNAMFCAFDSAVEYTTKLQRERHAMQEEADQLRKQIQDLNTSIRYYVIYMSGNLILSYSDPDKTGKHLI